MTDDRREPGEPERPSLRELQEQRRRERGDSGIAGDKLRDRSSGKWKRVRIV